MDVRFVPVIVTVVPPPVPPEGGVILEIVGGAIKVKAVYFVAYLVGIMHGVVVSGCAAVLATTTRHPAVVPETIVTVTVPGGSLGALAVTRVLETTCTVKAP